MQLILWFTKATSGIYMVSLCFVLMWNRQEPGIDSTSSTPKLEAHNINVGRNPPERHFQRWRDNLSCEHNRLLKTGKILRPQTEIQCKKTVIYFETGLLRRVIGHAYKMMNVLLGWVLCGTSLTIRVFLFLLSLQGVISALYPAIDANQLEMVKFLIKKGASLTKPCAVSQAKNTRDSTSFTSNTYALFTLRYVSIMFTCCAMICPAQICVCGTFNHIKCSRDTAAWPHMEDPDLHTMIQAGSSAHSANLHPLCCIFIMIDAFLVGSMSGRACYQSQHMVLRSKWRKHLNREKNMCMQYDLKFNVLKKLYVK